MILVVADTSPIHYLILIDTIEVLPRLYDRLVVPSAVFEELTHARAPEPVRQWTASLPSWAEVRHPSIVTPIGRLDPGETQAIALARELNAAAVLLDEWEARQEALRMGLPVAGTLGILEKASQRGLLDLRQAIQRLLQTNFRIDRELVQAVLVRQGTKKSTE